MQKKNGEQMLVSIVRTRAGILCIDCAIESFLTLIGHGFGDAIKGGRSTKGRI